VSWHDVRILRLDELVRGVKGARSRLANLQELSHAELNELREEFPRLHDLRAQQQPRMDAK